MLTESIKDQAGCCLSQIITWLTGKRHVRFSEPKMTHKQTAETKSAYLIHQGVTFQATLLFIRLILYFLLAYYYY